MKKLYWCIKLKQSELHILHFQKGNKFKSNLLLHVLKFLWKVKQNTQLRDIHNITFGYLFFWLRDNKCHVFRCILQNFNCSMVADPLQTHTIHRYQTVSCKNRRSNIFYIKEKFMLNLRNATCPSLVLFCPSSTFAICANSCLSVKYLGNYLNYRKINTWL